MDHMRADVTGEKRHDLMLVQHKSLELIQLALLTLRSAALDLTQQIVIQELQLVAQVHPVWICFVHRRVEAQLTVLRVVVGIEAVVFAAVDGRGGENEVLFD